MLKQHQNKIFVNLKTLKMNLNIGDVINVDHFIEGEFVDVSGISKGKGFQGVVKRHGFVVLVSQLTDNITD